MENIIVGDKVIITRTDGRIHNAVVDAKHEDMQSVTVIWTEGNKLMGKEIPWDYIQALNPNLICDYKLSKDQLKFIEKREEKENDESVACTELSENWGVPIDYELFGIKPKSL